MSKSVKKIASFAAPIIGAALGGPAGAAIGGAIGGGISGKGLKGALIGAATGYAGNAIGSSIGSSLTGSLAKAGASNAVTNSVANSTIGRLASNVVGPATGASLIGNAAGGFAGNSIASSLAGSVFPQEEEQSGEKSSAPAPFVAKQQSKVDLPGSLTSYGGLDEGQQSSNLATQGVYGGGLGGEEQSYFTNLINRKLVDESGNVDQDLSDVSPIESSYLSQIGLGGYQNSSSLLEALSKWKAA